MIVRFIIGNFEDLKSTVAGWTPERQAKVTGISADELRDLVDAYVNANAAALNMATGVNQGRSGTLCYWLLESISAITGNFDRKGGNLIGEGIIDFAQEEKRLAKEIAKVEKEMAGVSKKLHNEDFLAKAPPEVVEKVRDRHSGFLEKHQKLQSNLEKIRSFVN